MPWVRAERVIRHYAGRAEPFESQLKPGHRARIQRLKQKGGWVKHPYEGVIQKVEWGKRGKISQFMVTESHETRRGNVVTRTHPGGFTEFEVWLEEGELLPPLDKERPPFALRQEVRFKRTQDESWTTDAIVEGVKYEAGLSEPRWEFAVVYKLGPSRIERREVINCMSHDIEASASRMHPLPPYNSSKD